MKTIKCKIANDIDVSEYLRKYNSVLHIAYNCLKDRISQSEIKKIVNPKFDGLNSFIIQNAIIQAQGILVSYLTRKQNFEIKNPNKKFKEIYFGGRKNLRDYLSKRISKEEFRQNRLMPMSISGETRQKGNRLFNLNIDNSEVIFKPSRGIKIPIQFVCSKKQKEELLKVQKLCLEYKFSVAITLNNENISFCFNEEKLYENQYYFEKLNENRVLGIDQNPNYLGISIIEFDKNNKFKVLHKQVFDLTKLTIKSGKSSSDKKSKYLTNKRKFETINLAYEVDKLVKYWKCKKVIVEDLSLNTKSLGFKCLNRLCKNSWNRNLFKTKLKMLSKIHGYEYIEVNPCYSSIIGNIMFGNETTPDMVAASIEIARRGFNKYQKNWFYPDFKMSLSQMDEQWKQTSFDNHIKEWKELFSIIKESELKYRISLDQCKPTKVLSLNNKKSYISLMQYNIF